MRKSIADHELSNKVLTLLDNFFESCSIPVTKMCSTKPGEIVKASIHAQQLPRKVKSECSSYWAETKHITIQKNALGPGIKAKLLHRLDEDDLALFAASIKHCTHVP